MKSKNISKFLSLILRHKPEELNITLDEYGWASVDEIIVKMTKRKMPISRAVLEKIVAENDKQRFTFSDDGTKIRANQGHSIKVNLELKAETPPQTLYHGTGAQNEQSILKKGILKSNRQHVHLSADKATAKKVGGRHGKPIIFQIDTYKMLEDGITFFQSKNEVWLTDYVDPKYISLESKGGL